MGLWLLTNTIGRDAAEIRVTDQTNVEVAASESSGIDVIRGGPRSLKWTQVGSNPRRIVYVNRSGIGPATHCVIVDAALHQGRIIHVWGWDDYASSGGAMHGNPVTPLVGIDRSDWVFKLTTAYPNAEAFGVNFPAGYSKSVRQIYLCDGMEFTTAQGPVNFQRVPVHASAIRHCRNYYKLHASASFVLGPVSRADIDRYYSLPKEDPVFFYDDTGGADYGRHILHKLWHCVIMSDEIVVSYNDNAREIYFIKFEIGILKHGDG